MAAPGLCWVLLAAYYVCFVSVYSTLWDWVIVVWGNLANLDAHVYVTYSGYVSPTHMCIRSVLVLSRDSRVTQYRSDKLMIMSHLPFLFFQLEFLFINFF